MQPETVGSFVEPGDGEGESLVISFSPSSRPLQERWRNNGLSADFMADYVTTFIPREEGDPSQSEHLAEIKGGVAYIANELLENAMKYSPQVLGQPIRIELGLESERAVFTATNATSNEQADFLYAFIDSLAKADPITLYMERLEASARGENEGGLGLLTMVNDYGAELAWRFQPLKNDTVMVTVQVKIEI